MAWEKMSADQEPPASTKQPRQAATAPAIQGNPDGQPAARRDPRRSRRVHIAVPVMIYGRQDEEPFQEETVTDAVNAQGAMIRLAAAVERGQKLVLTNAKSGEEVECHVAYLGQPEAGKMQVGIEFTRPAEHFWHIAFPPDDWDPAERKRPSISKRP